MRAAGLTIAGVALAGPAVAALLTAAGTSAWTALALGAIAAAGAGALVALRRDTQHRVPAPPEAVKAAVGLEGLGREVIDALSLGVVLIDAGGRVAFTSRAAEEIMERRVTGLVGAAALRTPALTEAIAAALEDGVAASLDVTLLRAKERVVHATVTPLDGEAHGARVLVVLEDRTRAAKAEALRRDFVSNASHELRTPLASISGFIETLQGHARDDPEAADRFLSIMAAQAERMRRLIDDLLSLNRIEINEHVMPRDRVDLLATVRDTASAMAPVARARGTAILCELPESPAIVRGSADELSQLFANLIDNALKYAGDEGPVRICPEGPDMARPGMIGISVVDRGPGIAREHLPRLTERFYRVGDQRGRERGGTGLGLAIAKHILNRHRGDLGIASTPGEGARFTVWLPLASAQATVRAA